MGSHMAYSRERIQQIPLRLWRAFPIGLIHGTACLTDEELYSFFLRYISLFDEQLIERAISGDLDDEEQDEWLDFLS